MKKICTPQNSGILPMIATTGSPTREGIRAFLQMYKDVGIQQFLFFGRAGCEYEYLSERWFEMCGDFLSQAEELGMCVWMYDDYNCPTTIVNGRLPALGPAYQTKYIDIYLEDGKFICNRLTNPTTGDILGETAMNYFVESTYEAYAVRFSKYFGTTVRGIFTDEPTQAFGSINRNNKDGHLRFPAYDGIDSDYREFTGRSLEADLEMCIRNYRQKDVVEIANYAAGPDGISGDNIRINEADIEGFQEIIKNNPGYAPENEPAVLWPAYWRLIGIRMRKYYLDRLSKWCGDHGLYLTGHLYGEHASEQAVFRNGDPMHVLRGFTFPGMDEVYTETSISTAEWVTLGMVQDAVLYRGVGGMAEILSLGPCDMPPSKVRQMIWLTALFNINNYLIAVAQLNAKGNVTRGGFYGPYNPVQPYFPMYRQLAEDAQEAAVIAGKECEYSIAVKFPRTMSAKRAVYNTYTKNVYDDINELRLLLAELTDRQFPWRLIPEDDSLPDSSHADSSGNSSGNSPGYSSGNSYGNDIQTGEIVIEVTDNGYIFGRKYHTLDELLQKLETAAARKAFVTGIDGRLCRNLVVRTYSDGTIVILDLNQDEQEREYILYYVPDGSSVIFDFNNQHNHDSHTNHDNHNNYDNHDNHINLINNFNNINRANGCKRTVFTLAGRGVKVIRASEYNKNNDNAEKNIADIDNNSGTDCNFVKSASSIPVIIKASDWSISYDSPNLLRCDLSKQKKEFKFICEDNIEICRLLVRQYGDIPSVMMDGNDVGAVIKCNSLPAGFAELYFESGGFSLSAGEHTLALKNECAEYPYLAGIYLCGKFSVFDNNTAAVGAQSFNMKSDMPQFRIKNGMPPFKYGSLTEAGLLNYTGKIICEGTVAAPDGENAILMIDAFSHYTEVYIGGEYLGGRAWAPYKWDIPAGISDGGSKTKLKIILSGSFGPMFGKIDELKGITEPVRSGKGLIPGGFRDIGLKRAPYVTAGSFASN